MVCRSGGCRQDAGRVRGSLTVEEQTVEDDVAGQPGRAEQGLARQRAQRAGQARARRRGTEPRREPRRVAGELLARRLPRPSSSTLGRDLAGDDRGVDPLAARGVGEPRRVAHEQHARADDRPRRPFAQAIRVTPQRRREAGRYPARLGQPGQIRADLARERLRVAPAEADVQVVALAEAPAVAREVAQEVQLRPLGRHAAERGLLGRETDLHLLRDDGALRRPPCLGGSAGPQLARDRAEVPAGADEQRGLDVVVQQPAVALAPHPDDTLAEPQARARTPQQVAVELAAADAVADDGPVVHLAPGAEGPADAEAAGSAAACARPRRPRGPAAAPRPPRA